MQNSKITWTEKTWNPWTGCKKVSSGCSFCYAETITERFPGTFKKGFNYDYKPHKLNEPLKLKKPSMIFVNSMSDFFWEEAPDEHRDAVLAIIKQTPQHIYQVLTKRPEVAKEYFKTRPVPKNFWLGVSVESNKTQHRIRTLTDIEAHTRFISYEPLLENLHDYPLYGIHWVIVGGESGQHLAGNPKEQIRERSLIATSNGKQEVRGQCKEWVNKIKRNCEHYEVAFYFKQWGGRTPDANGNILNGNQYQTIPVWRTWNEEGELL